MEQNNLNKTRKAMRNEYNEMKPVVTKQHSLRFIEPYEYKFQVYIKRRWIGKVLIDILANEFKLYDKEDYLTAIKEAKLLINHKLVDPTYVFCDSDYMTHIVTRSESRL